MRILVLSNLYPPDFIGGYELGCRRVVDALLARGHEVRVLTTAPRTPVPPVPHVHRTLHLTDTGTSTASAGPIPWPSRWPRSRRCKSKPLMSIA